MAASAAGLLLASCGDDAQAPASESPIEEPADGDWIRIDGRVVTTGGSGFVLDYGDDTINVEVDDWDRFADGAPLLPGDRVSVTGRIDDDLLYSDSIEAGAVYVHSLRTVYYANAADEEEFGLGAVPLRPMSDGVDYTGRVTGTSEAGFTLGSGRLTILVDTSGLETPLAEFDLDVGDRVYVWGDLDLSNSGPGTLVAAGVVKLAGDADEPSTGPTSAGKSAGRRPDQPR